MVKDLTRLRSISSQIVFVICVVSVIVPLLVWVSDYRLPVTSDLVCYNDACNMSGPVHVTLDGIIASNSKAFDVAQWDHTRLDNGRNLYHFSDEICNQFPAGSSAQRVCHHHYGMSAFIITTLVLIIVAAVFTVFSVTDGACISRVVKKASDMAAEIPCLGKMINIQVADAARSVANPGRAFFVWLLIMLSAVFWETYLVGHTHGGVHDQRAAGSARNASGTVTWDGHTPVSQGFGYGCIYMLQYYLWAATAVSTLLFLLELEVFGQVPAEAVDVANGVTSTLTASTGANKRVQMQGIELRNLELLRPSQVSVRNTRTAPTVRGSLLQQ